MKSIIENLELENGRDLYVQISEGGRVTLSFDGNEANTTHYLTVKDLKKYHAIISAALEARAAQTAEELAA